MATGTVGSDDNDLIASFGGEVWLNGFSLSDRLLGFNFTHSRD